MTATNQSPAAEQDHEDDEGFKPVVLHNSEASPAEVPPLLASTLGDVHSQKWPATHTFWGGREGLASLQKVLDFRSIGAKSLVVLVGLQGVHTVSEAGLWLHWFRFFFFHLFWFRLWWLVVHCAAYRSIPVTQSPHQLDSNHKGS